MTKTIETYLSKPDGFTEEVQISACYLEIDGRILLLQSAFGKREPGTWGVPAGKLEAGESPTQAAQRELFEETGIRADLSRIQFLGTLYMRRPDLCYSYHMFRILIAHKPSVQISKEHTSYVWASQEDLKVLPLMTGALPALERYRSALTQLQRAHASINGYLLLKKEEEILLQLRQNTGYCDHQWALPSGHIEKEEAALAGMKREAKEEIGIDIQPDSLKALHVMHRKTNRLNIDLFFECSQWTGNIQNCEPNKCKELRFFPTRSLPKEMVDYQALVLKLISQEQIYSEWGFTS